MKKMNKMNKKMKRIVNGMKMKNKQGKGPQLLWVIISLILFVGVMLLIYSPSWGIYNGLMDANNRSISSEYSSTYNNLTSNQDSLTEFSNKTLSPTNIGSVFVNTGLGVVNTLTIGLSVINLLVQIPTYVMHLSSILSEQLHFPAPIFWMILTIVGIYIGLKIVQALRGTVQEP